MRPIVGRQARCAQCHTDPSERTQTEEVASFLIALALALALTAIVMVGLALLATGRLTIDIGWGRRVRQLGPQVMRIEAPRDVVFDQIAVPYLSPQPPAALGAKIKVLDRGSDMVVAAHRTTSGRVTTVTVESVRLSRPDRITFQLLRGPVPFVSERFLLEDEDGGDATRLEYTGEMGSDLWWLGALWADLVATQWQRAVAGSLAALKESAELAASRAARRAADRDDAAS